MLVESKASTTVLPTASQSPAELGTRPSSASLPRSGESRQRYQVLVTTQVGRSTKTNRLMSCPPCRAEPAELSRLAWIHRLTPGSAVGGTLLPISGGMVVCRAPRPAAGAC